MWRSLPSIVMAWCAVIYLLPQGMAEELPLATTVDGTFRFTDTNVTEIRDLELFSDERIAYGGVGPNDTAGGIALPNGTPQSPNDLGFFTVTKSVSIDTVDGAFFAGGSPRFGDSWVVQRFAAGNDIAWMAKTSVSGAASKVLVFPDRDVLAAGTLRVPAAAGVFGLVRLNLEGSIDAEFAFTNTLGLEVITAAIMTDGSVLASYQQTNEQVVSYGLGRWLRNGQRDLDYDGSWANTGGTNSHVTLLQKAPGTNGFIAALQTEPAGAGGPKSTQVTILNEQGNWTGSVLAHPFIEGAVHAIAFETVSNESIEADGYDRVLVGGEFTKVEDVPCNRLASITKEGAVAWAFPTNAGPSGPVHAIEVQLDGKVLIGGAFTNVNGIEALGMARILGSSVDADRLFWADAEFRGFEKSGAVQMTLKRSGNLDEPLIVELARPLNAENDVTIPNTVEFAEGQSIATVPVTIQNDLIAETRERFAVTAIVTNENILLTRGRTELVILDDETPGTLDPTLQIPPMLGLTGFTFQPDGKILFYGSGRNIVRLNPDGTIDPNFITNALPTTGNFTPVVHQAIVQSDGKIVVAGTFVTTSFSQVGRNNLARLNSDGTLDLSFDPRLSSPAGVSFAGPLVKAMLLDDDSILIWLERSIRHETASAKILRLDRFGFVVSQYSSAGDYRTNGEWVLTENGELITYSNGQRQLRKYKADRTVDTNFVAEATLGSIDEMQMIGDALWIAGDFQNVNNTLQPHLARLNATTGELEMNGNLDVNGEVNVVREYGGKIYIGGSFTRVNGVERFRIARLNGDGSLEASFDPGNGPNRSIGMIDFQMDGKPLIGSGLDRVDGVPTSWYVRLEGDHNPGKIQFVTQRIELSETNGFVTIEVERIGGSQGLISATLSTIEGSALADQQFGSTNVTFTFSDGELGRKSVRIAISADTKLTGNRTFSVMLNGVSGGEEATVVLRDTNSPLLASALVGSTTNAVRDMAVDPQNGWLYVVGNFTNVNEVAITNLVRLNSDLQIDESLLLSDYPVFATASATNVAPIEAVAVRDNGIAIAGQFNRVGTNQWANVIRVKNDGSFETEFNAAVRAAVAGTLSARHLVYEPDGQLVASIQTSAGSIRFNPDGTRDNSFAGGTGFGSDLWLDAQGRFYDLANVTPIGVRRSDTFGLQDGFRIPVSYALPSGLPPNPVLNTIAIQADGKVLVGGAFSHAVNISGQSPSAPRFVRVLTNGVRDTNFVAVVGTNTSASVKNRVSAVQPLADGSILFGGQFDLVNGKRQTMLALVDTNGNLRSDFQVDVVGETIDQFTILPDGDVIVRGNVISVDGVPVGNVFKLALPDVQPPAAIFLWPTNGAEVRVTDVPNEVRMHVFDPDGYIERVVLELDGQPIATNSSGNVAFPVFLPQSGEHQLSVTATDASGLTTTATVTFETTNVVMEPLVLVRRDGGEIVITYQAARLQQSDDLEGWTDAHTGGGEYRTPASEAQRFYRAASQ